MARRRPSIDEIFEPEDEEVSFENSKVHSVIGGVSVLWLMKAFRLSRASVEKKLVGCPAVGLGRAGTTLYDLPTAASYLVAPRIDIAKHLGEMKAADLPRNLQETYWAAKLKEQRWAEKAGELWRSDKVLDVFSEILMDMRTRLQLIPDGVERNAGITPEQRVIITQIVDSVQSGIHQSLVDLSKGQKTPSQLEEGPDGDEEDD